MNIPMRLVICLVLTTFSFAVHAQSNNNNKGATPVEVENGPNNPVPVTVENEVSGSMDIESLPQSLVDKIDDLVEASEVRKIPVRCAGFAREGNRDSFAARLTCSIRGTEETSFSQVPAGKYVALTDVVIAATNIASVDQRYNLSIGAGTSFGPGGSGARFIGTTDAGSRSHFTTPFVIATEGKSILVNNFARSGEPAFEGMDANVEVFGYMADIDTLGY